MWVGVVLGFCCFLGSLVSFGFLLSGGWVCCIGGLVGGMALGCVLVLSLDWFVFLLTEGLDGRAEVVRWFWVVFFCCGGLLLCGWWFFGSVFGFVLGFFCFAGGGFRVFWVDVKTVAARKELILQTQLVFGVFCLCVHFGFVVC